MVELTAPGTRSRLYCWQACTSVQILCSRATAGRLVESADCLHLRQRETSCMFNCIHWQDKMLRFPNMCLSIFYFISCDYSELLTRT